jgi:sulfite reductase (NADPH) flavoprotein alpha-component
VPDLLRAYPVDSDHQTFISQLRRITPRLYSIASSQKEVENEVHLTVGLVEYHHQDYKRQGAASGYLSQLSSGDKVNVFVEPNKHFKLPEDDTRPIIMIGAGTGIAPYRGFLQERVARGASGQHWLVFGNQYFAKDFYYQLEWQQLLKKKQLHKISLAFSRDQDEKVYVQHKLKQEAKLIYQWIEEGAYLYLCGDKNRFSKSVEKALLDIIAEQSGETEQQALNRLTELRKSGRFQKDVY